MIMDKIPERFPKFKVAFLEASSQWLPYVLKDLDKRYKLQGRELNAKDLLRRSRFYVGCETSDDLPYIMGQAKVVGEKLYRSYYFDPPPRSRCHSGRADDYYIYQTPDGKLVIPNKQPPPGSTIIKQLLGETAPAQEPGKQPPNVKPGDSPKPTKDK